MVLLPILYTTLFLWLISRMGFFRASGLGFKTIAGLFLLKVLAGTALTLVYTYYYTDRSTSDIYKYFDDGRIVYNVLKENPLDYLKLVTGIGADAPELQHYLEGTKNWHMQSQEWLDFIKVRNFNYFNSNRLVTRFNAVAMLLSQGNIYVHTVFMCFLSLIGSIGLYRALVSFYKEKEKLLLGLIFLLPAVLFWQSGVLKEGLLIFFTGMFFYHFMGFFNSHSWVSAIAAIVCLLFIVLCKYYVAVALLPGLIAYTWQALSGGRNAGYKVAYTFLGLMAGLAILLYAAPQYNPLKTLCDKRNEAIKSAVFGEAKELLFMDDVEPHPAAIVAKLPEVARITFVEPMVISKSPLILMATMENLLVLALILLFAVRTQKQLSSPAVFWLLLSYALIILFIIAFTTPVAGGLVRYKTAGIPFLLMALLMLSKPIKTRWFSSAIG